ncbi:MULTISPECIES: MmoB/DmpM family protein [unclassified Crossiella]|uniref:MmoB/DmpM family protein n=1 Tax=unclassified Crossiella TaxID=2620835 RepID=UPI001FFEFCE9|nr:MULTISPECIES: MmoB/DmpM family protein [unclassified Crossiella]MCK2239045.1 MmoB/DmpM family protein [Crossiella sp. S99.2]MCK2251386.1 MmoB/DmpM family protein [Crossiella sp. S99.1]
MSPPVGPVLLRLADTDRVLAAIVADNPEVEVVVRDQGSYLRVEGPGFLRLRLATLREHVDQHFELRMLEAMTTSFAGRISISSTEVQWSFRTDSSGEANP